MVNNMIKKKRIYKPDPDMKSPYKEVGLQANMCDSKITEVIRMNKKLFNKDMKGRSK